MNDRAKSPSLVKTSFAFVGIAILCFLFSDVQITTFDPWTELGRMAHGIVTPDFFGIENLSEAIFNTLSFALLGVTIGSVSGFFLALLFRYRLIRVGAAFARAIHELFWALIFIQLFGLSVYTGILAIAIPYAGIFAKVYSEIMEESDPAPLVIIPGGAGYISTLFYARLPNVWPHIKTYTLYRMECGVRSSAVLGFIGLPTLGFHLESAFAQGYYSQVGAILILFYLIVVSMRAWMRPAPLPFYLAVSLFALPAGSSISWPNVIRFFTVDIVPYPIRLADTFDTGFLSHMSDWTWELLIRQALPGTVNTIMLTMIALATTGILALLLFPLISSKFFGRGARICGHTLLVIMRSTPEYILAFIFLILWGPSMAPAIVALTLHNAAIIGHLIGHYTESLLLRPDSPKGVNLYAYEVVPGIYKPFMAFLFYRWEVIMRETAILGILGIKTLGFYIDSAFADIRTDRALALILITAVLNIGIDSASRTIRRRLNIKLTPQSV